MLHFIDTTFTRALHSSLAVRRQLGQAVDNEDGMSTIEYALGSLAAAALAGVLFLVVKGGGVTEAFESIITDALNNRPG